MRVWGWGGLPGWKSTLVHLGGLWGVLGALSVLTPAPASTLCSAWTFGACSRERSGWSGLRAWCVGGSRNVQCASTKCHAPSILTPAPASTLCSAWTFGACSRERSGCSGLNVQRAARKCHALSVLTPASAFTPCSAWMFGACSRER